MKAADWTQENTKSMDTDYYYDLGMATATVDKKNGHGYNANSKAIAISTRCIEMQSAYKKGYDSIFPPQNRQERRELVDVGSIWEPLFNACKKAVNH